MLASVEGGLWAWAEVLAHRPDRTAVATKQQRHLHLEVQRSQQSAYRRVLGAWHARARAASTHTVTDELLAQPLNTMSLVAICPLTQE